MIVAIAIDPREAELAIYGAVATAHNADVVDPHGSRTFEWLRRAFFDLPASARAAASDAFERYWLDPRAPPP